MNPGAIAGIVIAIVVVVAVVVVLIVLHLNKKKKIAESEKKADEKIKSSAAEVSDKFGGRDNIKDISSKGSRVTVRVIDAEKVDKKAITETLEQVMFMGEKVVFVIGSKSEEFKQLLEENVDKNLTGNA